MRNILVIILILITALWIWYDYENIREWFIRGEAETSQIHIEVHED